MKTDGWSNLHKYIVRYGDEDSPDLDQLDELLDEEVGDCVTRIEENSILHFAAIGERTHCLKYLIPNIPSYLINKANKNGETPLHWACRAGHIENIKILLEANADTHKMDFEGNSILHFAVEAGDYKVTRFLLKNSLCAVDCKNKQGVTPLAIACRDREYRIVKLLKRNGSCTMELLQFYIQSPKMARYLSEETKKTVKGHCK